MQSEFDDLLENAPTSREGLYDKHEELVKFPRYYSLSYSSEENPFDQTKTKEITYTDDYIRRRSRMIPLAINARAQTYPEEVGFNYLGSYLGSAQWYDSTRAELAKEDEEYWQYDIII